MAERELVHREVRERVALLMLDNPPVNALSLDGVQALSDAVRGAIEDPLVKVLVLTTAGEMGCPGANVADLAAMTSRAEAQDLSRKGQALADLIEGSPKPVIGALGGRYVLGGGNELFMACHLRVVEARTQLGSPETRLGLMVGWGGSQRLLRLVGLGRAADLLLTGRRLGAEEALAIGLVNRIVPDGALLDEAMRLARELAALSAPVLAATLDALRVGLRDGYVAGMAHETELFAALCENDDWREGTRAFLEKRPPRFTDS